VLRGDIEIVGIKNHAAVAASTRACVRKDRLHLPRFYARIEIQLLSLPNFAFLLFHVLDSAPLIRIEHSFLFL